MFGADDDEDFTPSVNSKLASLFGQPMEEGNSSLTYTAPKQPKKTRSESASPATGSPGKLGIIIAKAVQTYRLDGSSYNNQGKLGVALIGNPVLKLYQLLLYKDKQQHVTTTKITENFQFTVQPQNFASFYDVRGQNWSIMFDSESNAIDFAREIGLARSCTQSERVQPFYVQDLKVGEGSGADIGDLLEIRYSVLPFVNGHLEKAIESNIDAEKPQRVNIRKGVWEEALIGAAKGCRKLIVLAPALFGPWKPLADANHHLVVEVEVGRIKSRRRSRESTPIEVMHHADSSESNVDSSTDETSIKARGASISEALTNSPKTHKASIISRMARMGQATLPLKGTVMCNPSDSEETEEETSGLSQSSSLPAKSSLKPRNLSTKRSATSTCVSTSSSGISHETTSSIGSMTNTYSSNIPAQQLSVFQPASLGWHPQNHQYLINGVPVNFATHPESQLYASSHQVVPVPAVVPTPSGTPSSDSHLSVFFSENRTHNAEVRMGLTKMTDKVDKILGKLDSLQQPPGVGVLEPKVLLSSIQKLVLENEQLQTELTDRKLKMEQQNDKIYQLLHNKLLEQNASTSSLDQRPDSSFQTVILGLQEEKAKLASDLSDAISKINTLQIQATNFEQISIELREEVKNLTARLQTTFIELDNSKLAFIEQEGMIRKLKEMADPSVNSHNTQDSLINDLEMKMRVLQDGKTQLETSLLESKQQLEQLRNKMCAEISTLKTAHKEEIVQLEKQYKLQFAETLKNNANCNEDTCSHYVNLQSLERENEELKSCISDMKNNLKATGKSSIDDLKKVMNVMFRILKSEFQPGTSYDGSTIRDTILSSIQDVTLQFVKMKTKANIEVAFSQRDSNGKTKAISVNITEKSKQAQDELGESMKMEESMEKANKTSGTSSDNAVDFSGNITDTDRVREECNTNVNTKANIAAFIEESKERLPESQISIPTEKPHLESKEEKQVSATKDDSLLSTGNKGWRPQPPPSPPFDEEEDDDDWLS